MLSYWFSVGHLIRPCHYLFPPHALVNPTMRIRDHLVGVLLVCSLPASSYGQHAWESKRVHSVFYTEGASAGDIDGDGNVDVVAGPLWYRGPDFQDATEITASKSFPVAAYSDQFFSHVADVNGDHHPDVIVVGFPGEPARLYVNPGPEQKGQHWLMREITGAVDNESPALVDLVPGGAPELVCGRDSQYGYYQATDDPTSNWRWHPISAAGACAGRFTHSLGVGDVDGDGRLDIIDRTSWWQQPEDLLQDQPWRLRHWAAEPYGQGGAQICVGDVDGDGDADIVTSLNAHGFGLAWFEQVSLDRFDRHDIMGTSSLDSPYGVAFSQLHAVALEDIDGDGRLDIVTGKRWLAHGGHDPGGLQEPVLYWFQCQRSEQGTEFVPRRIDSDSGVGVEVLVTDLNGDALPDVVSSSKRGLSIHLQLAGQDQARSDQQGVSERWKIEEGRDQSTYADGWSPELAAENMLVPEGFAVDLIASEPELTQPIAMCFDARGRIWVIEGHTYPIKAPEGEGRDRILILDDRDADGTFEHRTVFAEGLNLASGIEVGFGGVWVGAAPELLFIADANQDDVPDSEPKVVLDGWGYQDTHETLNSFTWGPDGWLYGCQGIFTHSLVGKPGTPTEGALKLGAERTTTRAVANQRIPFNAGVWRYHPKRDVFEVFAHGSSNPWGVDFNDQGEWFISACVIPHLFHVIQGGRYQRQAGQHFNRYTYDDIKTIADHAHFAGDIREHAYWGDNKTAMPAAGLDTSMVGGGHAHCGLAIYNGDAFPPQYRGDLYFHNLHGHRLVRERVDQNGSGFVGRHRPDFSLARDHQQIGVGVMVGPDGALYTSDWHDIQTCHNRDTEVWNRSDGRIFRIRYGDVRPSKLNLWQEPTESLIEHLRSDNGFVARQAQRILQERAATGSIDVASVSAALRSQLDPSHSQRDRLRALWAMWVIGGLDEHQLLAMTADSDPWVRGWAVHLIGEIPEVPSEETLAALTVSCRNETSLVVRRYLASLLQRLPLQNRMPLIEGLVSHGMSVRDHNLPLLVWYAMEPLAEETPQQVVDLAARSGWPELYRFAVRRTAESVEGREILAKRISKARRPADDAMILQELLSATTRRGGARMPASWPSVFARLGNSPDPQTLELARSVAVQFGDQSVLPHFRQVIEDRSKTRAERLTALTALRTVKDGQLSELLVRLLDDPAVATDAASALAAFDDPHIADELLSRLPSFAGDSRTAALNSLVARVSFANRFVAAMEDGSLDAGQVPAFIIRQAVELGDSSLTKRMEQAWGQISVSSADKKELYARYRALLTPQVIAAGDGSLGRSLYETNCGKCHKLFGSGGEIGPDITGANRASVDYWLENILEPNSLIGRGYQMTSILTTNGQVVNGIVKEENDDAVSLNTATELVVIPRNEIETTKLSTTSLMPEGQLQPMTDQQVAALIKYLTGPGQVRVMGEE